MNSISPLVHVSTFPKEAATLKLDCRNVAELTTVEPFPVHSYNRRSRQTTPGASGLSINYIVIEGKTESPKK